MTNEYTLTKIVYCISNRLISANGFIPSLSCACEFCDGHPRLGDRKNRDRAKIKRKKMIYI